VGVERRGALDGARKGPARKLELPARLHRDPIGAAPERDHMAVLARRAEAACLEPPQHLRQPSRALIRNRAAVGQNGDLLLLDADLELPARLGT
jgi:hypothetical protein